MTSRKPLCVTAFLLSACGASTVPAGPTAATRAALVVETVSPASIKADFDGELVVSGAGFDATAAVEVVRDGLLGPNDASAVPVATTFVDAQTLHARFTGGLVAAGDYTARVRRAGETAFGRFHVRPVLKTADHARSLPKLFLRNGGFLDVHMIPTDSSGRFLAPGAEIAGDLGLGHANFQLGNVTLTPLAGGAAIHPDFAGVNDVLFDPVSDARPLAVALAIDQSGSIATTQGGVPASDPNDERVTQAEAFVSRLSGADEVEVLAFNGAANNVPILEPFTTDKVALRAALETLRSGETGGTPLYDAMIKAVAQAAAVPGAGVTRAAIVLTDGRDNGSASTGAQAIAAAKAVGIPIFTIGLGNPADAMSLDKAVLENVSDQTGGRFFFAQDPAALATVFDSISGILKSTYELNCGVSIDPPLITTGTFVLNADVTTTVDGTTLVTHLPPLNVSVN